MAVTLKELPRPSVRFYPNGGPHMPTTKSKPEQDRDLNKTLEQSFPASDPASTNQTDETPNRPIDRKPAIIDKKSVDALAKEADRKTRTRAD